MRNVTNENDLSTAADQSLEGFWSEFSRRRFVQLLMLGGLGLVIPAQISKAFQQPPDLHKELERIAGLVTTVQTEEPNLPGVRNTEKWANASSKKFSQQDAEILQGALYLKALKLLEENQQRKAPAPTVETIRGVLTDPEPMSCIKQDHLSNLLKATQMKMSQQPEFAREVKEASQALAAFTRNCPHPRCGIIVIIIIIIIIVVL